MSRVRSASVTNYLKATTLAVALLAPVAVSAYAEPPNAYTVEVSDVSAKVGQHAVMQVKLKPRDGYKVLAHYTNHVSRFSSLDDGVAFDAKDVPGTVEDNTLVFTIGLTPTKPGKHPINGVFRVGFIENPESMWMISVPLIATVIGTTP
jgi:hypothetical protein